MEQWNKLVGMVKEFYIAFGQQEFLEKEMTIDRMKLREKMFKEEQTEYEVAEKQNDDERTKKIFKWETQNAFNTILTSAFEEVHRSNMSKLGLDGKPIYREDGKIIKGPDYFPPNLKQFLEVRK